MNTNKTFKRGSAKLGVAVITSIISLAVALLIRQTDWQNKRTQPTDAYQEKALETNSIATHSYWTGLPEKTGLTTLVKTGHANGFDPLTYVPAWTSYMAYRQTNPHSQERPDQFEPDPNLPSKWRVESSEYSRTGYDRGHMAPNWAVSINFGRNAQLETFEMSNIAPQTPELNRGIWASLEKIIANDYAKRYGEITVFVGPLYTKPLNQTEGIGKKGRVKIPDAFYKIIVRDKENPKALALIIPQNTKAKQAKEISKNLVTIREVESLTGINFLPRLPKETQDRVENQKPTRMW